MERLRKNFNDNLEWWRQSLINKTTTMLDVLIGLCHLLQRSKEARLPEMIYLVDFIGQIVSGSAWMEGYVSDGDYDANRSEHFEFISGVLKYLFQQVCRFMGDDEVHIARADIQSVKDRIGDSRITDKMLINPWQLLEESEAIHKLIEQEDFAPDDAISLIQDHWDLVYMDRPVYHALEFILRASNSTELELLTEEEITNFFKKIESFYEETNN